MKSGDDSVFQAGNWSGAGSGRPVCGRHGVLQLPLYLVRLEVHQSSSREPNFSGIPESRFHAG